MCIRDRVSTQSTGLGKFFAKAMSNYDPDHDVKLLVAAIKRIAEPLPDGTYKTTFIKIFKDEILEQQLESLVGTMKAARNKGFIDFKGQMLLQGAHDNVEVTLLKS
eukprot:TRINITY_DN51_c0_g1_i1.p1 TRINITY_DN51_c0_g1~~TRINITY_DN51_c0_g1_i1.p1  ORF type:complete len:106 (+),score=27.91 TRINITY_DN51_c0_g1_i1:32-349(+)